MSWSKREAVTNLVILGDGEDQKKKIGGLLIGMPHDSMYPDKVNYEIVTKDGETIVLSGSASLSRQINSGDIGKFLKCEFTGWGKSGNGKFKIIEVNVWEGEPNADMKAWPRFGEFAAPKSAPAPTPVAAAVPSAPVDEEDDLPF
jgi:hypothetical protein